MVFRRIAKNADWLSVLKACPVKMDDLPPRRSEFPKRQAMSWLLDSDVLSQPAKKAGDVRVITWIEKHQQQCYTSSIVLAQLAFWVRTKRGKQRAALQMWLTQLVEAMQGRILGFNVSVAHVWADLQYQLQKAGKPTPLEDSYIAAIARRHNLTVATGNVARPKMIPCAPLSLGRGRHGPE